MKRSFLWLLSLGTVLLNVQNPVNADCCQQEYSCNYSCCDDTFVVGADWLYWKLDQDNMTIGTFLFDSEEGIVNFETGSNSNPHFKFENGFRAHAGMNLPCECWTLDVAYNYLPASAKWSTFIKEGEETEFVTIISDFEHLHDLLFPEIEDEELLDEFHAKWNSTLQYLDVDLSREITVCNNFALRPHMGFRAAWNDQKIRYSGIGDEIFTYSGVMKQKFRGYGVEGGLWGEWKFGCGLSLIGHFGGACLYSKMTVDQIEDINFLNGPVIAETYEFNITNTHKQGIGMLDYFIGINYEQNICNFNFNLHAGWEQHVFFSMNALSDNGGDLALNGLTLGLDIGF